MFRNRKRTSGGLQQFLPELTIPTNTPTGDIYGQRSSLEADKDTNVSRHIETQIPFYLGNGESGVYQTSRNSRKGEPCGNTHQIGTDQYYPSMEEGMDDGWGWLNTAIQDFEEIFV